MSNTWMVREIIRCTMDGWLGGCDPVDDPMGKYVYDWVDQQVDGQACGLKWRNMDTPPLDLQFAPRREMFSMTYLLSTEDPSFDAVRRHRREQLKIVQQTRFRDNGHVYMQPATEWLGHEPQPRT